MHATRLSLGTAQLGLVYGVANSGGVPDAAAVESILHTALELGITALDTSPVYGLAEQRIGNFAGRHSSGHPFQICSKLPALPVGCSGTQVQQFVDASIESSLRQLQVQRIDNYLVHRIEDLSQHGRALIEGLCTQQQRQRVGRIGISAYHPQQCTLLDEYRELSVLQHPLNLLDRRLEQGGQLRALRDRNVQIHARSAFLQGLFMLDPGALPDRVAHAGTVLAELHALLGQWGETPLSVALPFVLERGVDQVVLGVDSTQQLIANVEAARVPVPSGLGQALDECLSRVSIDVIDPTRWPVA